MDGVKGSGVVSGMEVDGGGAKVKGSMEAYIGKREKE